MSEPALRQRKAAAPEDAPAAPVEVGEVKEKLAAVVTLPEEQDWLTRHERYVPWMLTLVAAFTRFYRLDQPPGASGRPCRCTRATGFVRRSSAGAGVGPRATTAPHRALPLQPHRQPLKGGAVTVSPW